MVYLPELTFHFTGTTTTTATGSSFPRNIEGIISKQIIELNGMALPSCQNVSDLNQILLNLSQGSDYKSKRLYSNASVSGTGAPTSATAATKYKICQWTGFLGSVLPEALDLSEIGSFKLHIQLESANVLIQNGTGSSDYQLDNLYFTIPVLSIDDGHYYQAKNQYLANGNILELPFSSWYSSLFSANSYQQSSRFSIASQSLDYLMACFPQYRSTQAWDATLSNTKYFQYDGSGVADWSFSINNIQVPQFKPDRDSAFNLTLNSLSTNNDVLGGIDNVISTPSVFNKYFWVAGQRLNYPTSEDERYISGVNSLGTNAQISFDTTYDGTAGNTVCPSNVLLFAKTTSILRIGASKQLEIVS